MHVSLISLIFLAIAPFAPSSVQGTPAPAPSPAPAPEPWRSTHNDWTSKPNGGGRDRSKAMSNHTVPHDQSSSHKNKGHQSGTTNGFNLDFGARPQIVRVKPDDFYDDSHRMASEVLCTHLGSPGHTFRSAFVHFPFIGASTDIHSADSPLCGICVEMVYGEGKHQRILTVTLVDFPKDTTTRNAWSVSERAFGALADVEKHRYQGVDVQVRRVPNSRCGPPLDP